ncbi:MAG: hypothetical protein IJF98_04870 [Firmicutes bacterium]|nr:hypothetical protein [Bacillota bacterium]
MDEDFKNLNNEDNNEENKDEKRPSIEFSFDEDDTADSGNASDDGNEKSDSDGEKRIEFVAMPPKNSPFQVEYDDDDIEDPDEEDDEEVENLPEEIKKKRKWKRKTTNIIIIIIIILAVIVLVRHYNKTKDGEKEKTAVIYATIIDREKPESTEYDVIQSLVTENATKTYFRTDGGSFFYCTRDGIKYYSDMDTMEWADIYTLASPSIVIEEGTVAVTETSSKTVRVYSKNGPQYSVNTEGTITQAALNKNGYLSLILKNTDGYSVQVYDSAGTLIEERIDKMKGVYPVAVDISDDNRILAVSYLDTTDVVVKASIAFLYIDSNEGAKYMDSVYKTLDYEEQIIPWISFMKGNELYCVSDTSVFAISEDGAEQWNFELTNEVDSVYKYDDKRVIIAYGDKRINYEGKPVGTVCWYNLNGKEEGSCECGGKITYLSANKEGIVAGCGNVYKGISYSGKIVWQIVSTQTIDDVSILDKINRVLYVKRGSAEILKMR